MGPYEDTGDTKVASKLHVPAASIITISNDSLVFPFSCVPFYFTVLVGDIINLMEYRLIDALLYQ